MSELDSSIIQCTLISEQWSVWYLMFILWRQLRLCRVESFGDSKRLLSKCLGKEQPLLNLRLDIVWANWPYENLDIKLAKNVFWMIYIIANILQAVCINKEQISCINCKVNSLAFCALIMDYSLSNPVTICLVSWIWDRACTIILCLFSNSCLYCLQTYPVTWTRISFFDIFCYMPLSEATEVT